MDATSGQPRRIPTAADRQAVLDAAALLQLRRTETATALAAGRPVAAEILETRRDAHGQLLMAEQDSWSELLSVRPTVTTAGLSSSLPNTRALLDRGLRMTSIYDYFGTPADARLVLAGEPHGAYLLSVAPVEMKIVNRDHVLLQGPFLDGTPSVMSVRSSACLDAAWRYWEAVHRAAVPVAETVEGLADLTPRQHQVVAMLASGAADDAIAAALGVSVRTVRSDVARILDALGVTSRFAAGVRLHRWVSGNG
jgi:DNA-binding CsgD family transcriptional regulator